jgi:hypothetical protein
VAVRTELRASNPAERIKWDTLFGDRTKTKGAGGSEPSTKSE